MAVSDILAIIFAILIVAKIVCLLAVKNKKIIKLADKMYANTLYASIGFVVAAGVVLIALLRELSITQIMAGAVFGILVYGLALIQYKDQLLKLMRAALKDRTKMLFPSAVFLVLAVWAFIAAIS